MTHRLCLLHVLCVHILRTLETHCYIANSNTDKPTIYMYMYMYIYIYIHIYVCVCPLSYFPVVFTKPLPIMQSTDSCNDALLPLYYQYLQIIPGDVGHLDCL